MDFQRRFEAQEANLFFDDHRAMRPPVPNTIALGELQEDDHYYRGKVDGKLATDIPMPLTKPLLRRGQQRFGIYCVVCHGAAGNSKSMLRTRNMRVPPPSFMEARLRSQPVGYFFHVITNGVRNMPSYAAQVPPSDRWAIAAYVRALQIAGSASIDQVPPSEAARKGWRVQ